MSQRTARNQRRIRKVRGLLLRLRAAIAGAQVGRGVEAESGVLIRYGLHDGIRIGANVYLGRGLVIDVPPGARLSVGASSKLMHYTVVAAAESIDIGSFTQIAEHTSVRDSDHGLATDRPMMTQQVASPVRIGDDVWVGRGVAVLRGSCLGDGCVIGANAVVRGSIPPMAVAVGAPARVVRTRTH